MKIETIGDLQTAIRNIDPNTKIVHCCSHAGMNSFYLGANFNENRRAFKMSTLPGFGLYEVGIKDETKELVGIVL
jgi:hypothetical protein